MRTEENVWVRVKMQNELSDLYEWSLVNDVVYGDTFLEFSK